MSRLRTGGPLKGEKAEHKSALEVLILKISNNPNQCLFIRAAQFIKQSFISIVLLQRRCSFGADPSKYHNTVLVFSSLDTVFDNGMQKKTKFFLNLCLLSNGDYYFFAHHSAVLSIGSILSTLAIQYIYILTFKSFVLTTTVNS